jgi:hypothetical protein
MFECFFVVEIINLGYTWGTGISFIRLPLYLLNIFVQVIDIGFFVSAVFKNSNLLKHTDFASILSF